MTTERQLGAAIRQARTEAGLTQSELAELAGVSRALVSGVESASRPGAELQRVLAI
ncbi:MAG TPA: helix-turn-helix domain-containing protein, partial [Agrococcus sp.]|nr:helix-turn-helix domain-containing protein [Agrococcus sp.]